ncbi:NUDIX domain-containing protein [Alkalihalobacillus sp. LMS6]|uniref:NUDIX domain-containing protein n=1 Tax=Alkalihalobacillus sp. LMS6 TaxID=2924034 RepID=UPI0020D000D4|nr:NUDIX domain-containing protein [Alkalihalobacillus sp. LMS6]UTR06789.1 NUDIX domain-containing protein [Alkalihalobacillus sp. LMS6]
MIRQAVGAIVVTKDAYVLVCKSWQNTKDGKERIEDEWDIVKGGVEDEDESLEAAVLRELYEETGSKAFILRDPFREKLTFAFPPEVKKRIGFETQETTVFLVEFTGDLEDLTPKDKEISKLKAVGSDQLMDYITHDETKQFFQKYILGG